MRRGTAAGRQVSVLLVMVMLGAVAGAQADEPGLAAERHEYGQTAMGVEVRIVLHGNDDGQVAAAAEAAFERIHKLDELLSDYRVDSQLSRLGAGPMGEAQAAPQLVPFLARAEELSEATDGAFDVTAGPLVKLWRRAREEGRLPAERDVEQARSSVGWRLLGIDRAAGTVSLGKEGMALDVGGIGKGFAADEAGRILRAAGFNSFLIDLGGDLLLGAAPPGRDGWTIQAGSSETPAQSRLLVLSDCGVATSGDTYQYMEVDGVRYSHIIDPRTGQALRDQVCVTVVAPDGATADALASAACVLGPRAARRCLSAIEDVRLLVERPGFLPVFDGETLDGWTTRGGRYDGNALWTVEDGAITGREGPGGAGGLLYTERAYADLELELEMRISWPFDSGIFPRMVPDKKGVQLTIDYRPGGEVGGVYSEGFLQHNKDGLEQFKRDSWNHFELRLTGAEMHLEAWMNGAPLCDYRLPEDGEFRSGFARAGLLGLQVHGSAGAPEGSVVQFRDIRIRELP
ncbi:MAG: FAD:protein FMN transferase [Planctomycetota bacterium]|nr:FAD:protein FMN transferase [Planctomycetota bacterium]MDP6838251.1 FAD:protein FMN transferase [Planctomycetota bacterium]MDP6954942.1 FAD:protein FMN transferase [Planctomycetota bacterium]